MGLLLNGQNWYLNGWLHREDGPAIEWANGDRFWYLNGNKHRADGPAVELANGEKLVFEWQRIFTSRFQ